MRTLFRAVPWQTAVITAAIILLMGSTSEGAGISINSTSQNRVGPSKKVVPQQLLKNHPLFRVLAVNDLGMHCGDLDHRVASILPPFNVVHAQVVRRAARPRLLNSRTTRLFYSAAANPRDPALQRKPSAFIYKTNFWGRNPTTGNTYCYDAYNPFYPPGILGLFRLTPDVGLPVPDLVRLYLGDKTLTATQQTMPSLLNPTSRAGKPYTANQPQPFTRFDSSMPFFVSFPFGYTLTGVNWFAADGIPITPFDDLGRANAYPLMRVQAKDFRGVLAGKRGDTLASVDTVVPVAAEADCWRCHTSSVDGGNGQAACLPGLDANCPAPGSPTHRSAVPFTVVTAGQDISKIPANVKREWAADWNILSLHDAKHGTAIKDTRPVVCQRCHYSPALDLAHLGPLGPGDAAANGRLQKVHQTNSRALHSFHGKLDLFNIPMPPPDDPSRFNAVQGKPVVNTMVTNVLLQTCYQCHPGRDTNCLRGAMFQGGLVCQDCHGSMLQVGDDFSENFPVTPFPGGANLNKRIPWGSEPGCQSCHTGDALTTLAATDPNVIPSTDGIRLLQAYRIGDATATPIESPSSRFAENQVSGKRVLYRLSKDSHSGLACQACHGSTHAEWPVEPSTGRIIANDNQTAIQLQGHPGKIIECKVCHLDTALPNSLRGPHGMHPVGTQKWIDGHKEVADQSLFATCKGCHGATGEGTVLAKVAFGRVVDASEVGKPTVILRKGELVGCGRCHSNVL